MLIRGDARQLPLRDACVDCVVTSPPYYGLRDYGTATWEGGDAGCDHRQSLGGEGAASGSHNQGSQAIQYRAVCAKCGATRVDRQIGLEPSPTEYVATIVQVMREVWRVLKPTGTLWLNLGDSYAAERGGSMMPPESIASDALRGRGNGYINASVIGLKHKDLIGIPWTVAFALRSDGWHLRSDIVWAKSAPMPESVMDRPTRSHEYLFLLSKAAQYYYDADAIAEGCQKTGTVRHLAGGSGVRAGTRAGLARDQWLARQREHVDADDDDDDLFSDGQLVTRPARAITRGEGYVHGRTPDRDGGFGSGLTRNRRSVWTINPEPYSGAHFATMPEALVMPCILAGTSIYGNCARCGAPWERSLSDGRSVRVREGSDTSGGSKLQAANGPYGATSIFRTGTKCVRDTVGWAPTCRCGTTDVRPALVLDPFCGTGTVIAVAQRLGRRGVGVDLAYQDLARERTAQQGFVFSFDALSTTVGGEA